MTEASSKYARARSEWDSRFAHMARGKRNWQLAALGLLLANVTLAGGLAWLSTQARVTPFVVEVDRLGQATAFGPAEPTSDERLIRYQLGLLIRNLRTVFGDAEAQREVLGRGYAYMRGSALSFLNAHFAERNPFELARRSRVDVQVRSILPLSEDSWQVQWLETTRVPGGQTADGQGWQAVLTVEIDPPETAEALLVNPLGLYVTEIHWTPTL